jgi:Galactose oxidase, central domain
MSVPRFGATMTLLPNGSALVAGGAIDEPRATYDSAEVYSPTTGQWALTGPMPVATVLARATLLADGSVLIEGGEVFYGQVLAQAEVFTPAPPQHPAVALSPSSGPPGTTLTVTGNGFGPFKAVYIYFDIKKLALAATDGKGNFTATFRVPDASNGTHQVTAVQRFRGVAAQAGFRVTKD